MIKLKLFDDNSEDITYSFSDFNILAKQNLLSYYPNMTAVNHWHKDLEFIVILEGKMNFSVNGNNYELKEGQGIFINSKQMHYGYSKDGTDCIFLCILLPPSLLSNVNRIKSSYVVPVCKDSSHPFFIFDSSIYMATKFYRYVN